MGRKARVNEPSGWLVLSVSLMHLVLAVWNVIHGSSV